MIPDLSPFQAILAASPPFTPVFRPGVTQIRGSLILIDGSVLHIRENYIESTGWVDYAYQWQTTDHQLIIRWDNAAHHGHIATFPHHQHIGSDDNVQPSEPMTLANVLAFIAGQIAKN